MVHCERRFLNPQFLDGTSCYFKVRSKLKKMMRNKWNHTTHSTNIDKHPQALLETRKQTKGGTFRTKCVARRWLSGQRYLS